MLDKSSVQVVAFVFGVAVYNFLETTNRRYFLFLSLDLRFMDLILTVRQTDLEYVIGLDVDVEVLFEFFVIYEASDVVQLPVLLDAQVLFTAFGHFYLLLQLLHFLLRYFQVF